MHTLPVLAACLLASQGDAPVLRIDPLLLAQVVETYDIIASDGSRGWRNPVWPGWDAADTPILLYLPGVQDALLNHPDPPLGFHAASSQLLPAGWTLHLRNGDTLFDIDGQNTSTDINGIETLVVADPISNLRPGLLQLFKNESDVNALESALTVARLATDPYEQLSFVVHEAFHVHQFRQAPDKSARESWLLDYPWLSATNLAGFVLEGRLLERALLAEYPENVYLAALEFLAVRLDRRKQLSMSSVSYEDGTEFSEGLAKYTEWALSYALEGHTAGAPMRWSRGFRGYEDLAFWREELCQELRGNMDGELAVNGDPYGAGGLRFRLYYSGMAVGGLLDALEAEDWQERILEPGTTLTGLVRETLLPTDAELAEALERVREEEDYASILSAKKDFEAHGWADARERADAILASRPLFTLDYSAYPDAAVAWSFTPFGITKLADGRTIYGVVPLSANLGAHASFRQEVVAPALHDLREHKIYFRMSAKAASDAGHDGRIDGLELKLPGVTVTAAKAELQVRNGNVRLELLP